MQRKNGVAAADLNNTDLNNTDLNNAAGIIRSFTRHAQVGRTIITGRCANLTRTLSLLIQRETVKRMRRLRLGGLSGKGPPQNPRTLQHFLQNHCLSHSVRTLQQSVDICCSDASVADHGRYLRSRDRGCPPGSRRLADACLWPSTTVLSPALRRPGRWLP